ncbi:MAG: tetratricopeptide repeat protein [Rhabdochlamydiaceae bacterium]|jgi:TPR repeat protein
MKNRYFSFLFIATVAFYFFLLSPLYGVSEIQKIESNSKTFLVTDQNADDISFLNNAILFFTCNPNQDDQYLKNIYEQSLQKAEKNPRLMTMIPYVKYSYAKMRLLKGSSLELTALSPEMKRMADHGDVNAQNRYALMLLNGEGLTQDWEGARYYYKKAADQGDSDAQYRVMILDGEDGKKDPKGALLYFKIGDDQRHQLACFNYAKMLYNNKDCEADLKEARRFFKLSADLGFANAQYNYAIMLYQGEGGEKDLKEARAYFIMAAEQGHLISQNNYAIMLYKGEGGEIDLKEACTQFQSIIKKDDKNTLAKELADELSALGY